MEAIYLLNQRRTHQATAVKLLSIDPKSTFEVEISFTLIEEMQYFFVVWKFFFSLPYFRSATVRKYFRGGGGKS